MSGHDFYPHCPKSMKYFGEGGGIRYRIVHFIAFQKQMLRRTEQEARMRLEDSPPYKPPNTTSDYGLLTSCDSIR